MRANMDNKIKVSVVVPVYNQEAYLRDCLDSLHNQTLQEIEFILINDGSTDRSLEIMKEYVLSDSRFKLIDKSNGGIAQTINLGIKEAVGEYIAELDSDDYVGHEMYEKMYEVARQNNLDIVRSNLFNFTGSGEAMVADEEKIAQAEYYNRVIDPLEEQHVFSFKHYAWTSLYRRELLLNNDLFWNEGVSSYNDNGFFWQTLSTAKRVMYIDVPYVYHRRDNEQSTVKNPEKMFGNFFLEHAFIKEKLLEKGVFEELKGYFFERKINNYYFALTVIPYEKKLDFFKLMAEDFKKDIEEDGLNQSIFINPKNKDKINEIYFNPEQYYYQVYLPEYYKVTAIMPVHNGGEMIRNSLNDLIHQSLKEIEIILVENGSTDHTLEILQEYAAKDSRVRVLSIGSSNAGAARNIGFKHAHGDYVIFLDADDRFRSDMLSLAYRKGVANKAEIVWFKSERQDYLSGQRYPLKFAYREEQIPQMQSFSFDEIKGNPFKAFNGWAWDKLFKRSYLYNNQLQFQEQAIANDGFFTYMAMSGAKRISTINKVLVTQVMGHGTNISTTAHDRYGTGGYDMSLAVMQGLENCKQRQKYNTDFRVVTIQYLVWLFKEGFGSEEGCAGFFDLLVDRGLEQLGVLEVDKEELTGSQYYEFCFLEELSKYSVGEYQKFKTTIVSDPLFFDVPTIYPNREHIPRTARLIFGQNLQQGEGTVAGLFSFILEYKDTSNAFIVVDFLYMGDNTPLVKDTLNLSISLQRQEGELRSIVHQAEWDVGNTIFMENIYYSFTKNVLTIYAKYTGQYTGFEYNIKDIGTREGFLTYSTTINNKGYITDLLPKQRPEHIPISVAKRPVRLGLMEGYGRRTIFRISGDNSMGIDLFSVELPRYSFNNVSMAIDFAYLPNNRAVSYDTFYLGIVLEPKEDSDVTLTVFQAEWLHNRPDLTTNIYYYIVDNRLVVGARYNERWCGYNYKVTHIAGREYNEDYILENLAEERVFDGLRLIPADAVFGKIETSKKRVKKWSNQ